MLADYRGAYGFGSFALRYFNASGADASGDIGELRDNETHLIPRAMMALQGHVPDFAVFGDDYDTPDGTAIRDYIHVTDLAAAHLLALKLLLQGHAGGAFNLGTGTGFSVREILACHRGRDRPRSTPSRQAAASRRSDLSGRRPHRGARDLEIPPRAFGSCDHHPDRMGVAPQGSSAEGRREPVARRLISYLNEIRSSPASGPGAGTGRSPGDADATQVALHPNQILARGHCYRPVALRPWVQQDLHKKTSKTRFPRGRR